MLRPRTLFPIAVAIVTAVGATGRAGAPAAVQTSLPSAPAPSVSPTWKWTDEQIEKFWGRVSPGPTLAPAWPNGAVAAVALSFDYQAGTVYDPLDSTNRENTRSQYDVRVGLPRILRLLDKYQVPATFFVTGVTARFYPESLQEIASRPRHEIGVHGWIHENLASINDAAEEERLLNRTIEAVTTATGKRPVGYRAPLWTFSQFTLGLVQKAGFLYDSGMMADELPYEILMDGKATGLVEVPVEMVRNDRPYYEEGWQRPEDVHDIWKAEFDKMYDEHGLFEVTMHPRLSGHASRVLMLEKLISYMKSRPGVWFATHEEIARHALAARKSSAN